MSGSQATRTQAEVLCSRCLNQISRKEDLAVAGLIPAAYCPECYAKVSKAFFAPTTALLNSTWATISAVLSVGFTLVLVFFLRGESARWLLAPWFLAPVILRLSSWFMYERHLK